MIHLSAANDIHDDLPVLTDIISEPENDLPILTDIIEDNEPIFTTDPTTPKLTLAEPSLSQAKWLATIEQKIAAQLETTFAVKLATLQRQVTMQAIAEFKAELPALLREAMDKETH